jgi:hypothetical protein
LAGLQRGPVRVPRAAVAQRLGAEIPALSTDQHIAIDATDGVDAAGNRYEAQVGVLFPAEIRSQVEQLHPAGLCTAMGRRTVLEHGTCTAPHDGPRAQQSFLFLVQHGVLACRTYRC